MSSTSSGLDPGTDPHGWPRFRTRHSYCCCCCCCCCIPPSRVVAPLPKKSRRHMFDVARIFRVVNPWRIYHRFVHPVYFRSSILYSTKDLEFGTTVIVTEIILRPVIIMEPFHYGTHSFHDYCCSSSSAASCTTSRSFWRSTCANCSSTGKVSERVAMCSVSLSTSPRYLPLTNSWTMTSVES